MTTFNEKRERISNLSDAKRALLAKRLRGEEASNPVARTIHKRPEGVVVPLSFTQQRLWFLDRLDGQTGAYNISLAARLSGSIDVPCLQRSLDFLVQRHESLRTVFVVQGEQITQQILPAMPLALPSIDLRALSAELREAELASILKQESLHHFQLEQGPLIRVLLLQQADDEHVLFFCMHHIISDGWSQGIFFRELGALYTAYRQGKSPVLPALPIQYADFSLWQQTIQRETLVEEEVYWKQQLVGLQPLALPTDYPRPVRRRFKGARQELQISADLTKRLELLSQQAGTTFFMTLLGAFQVLMAHYSNQQDIAVGSPIANRMHEELEGVVGSFANTLVFRTDLSGDLTFLKLLERIKKVALDAYAHQNVPFEKVVELLQPARDLSRSPLFQVMFLLQNTPATQPDMAGLLIQPYHYEITSAKFDLILTAARTADGLLCSMEYDTALFQEQAIQRLLQHWKLLLEEITSNPQQYILEINLLTPEERQHITATLHATQADVPQDTRLAGLLVDNWIAPRNSLEADLADIWAELLDVKRVSIDDNFFAIGGHSLLIMQLTTRIRSAFAVDIPLSALFDMPTIAELAVFIENLVLTEMEYEGDDELLRVAGEAVH